MRGTDSLSIFTKFPPVQLVRGVDRARHHLLRLHQSLPPARAAMKTTTRRSAKAGLVTSLDVVTKAGGQAYIAGVTVATKEDNATRRRDAETIVAGLQVLSPAAM